MQWDLCIIVFFRVSREIMTSFCVCVKMVESKPNVSQLLMHCSCNRSQISVAPCLLQASLLSYRTVHNRGWQAEMLVRQNNMQHSVWIRAKPTTHPGMYLSHLIYSAPHLPVLALYILFDLLTLIVSLKISSSISSAILKPLLLPEREEAHSQCDVYLTFSTGPWLSGLWLLAEHIRLAGALPELATGHRFLDSAFLHPRSHKSQWWQNIPPGLGVGGYLDAFMVLVSCIRIVFVFVLMACVCICAFIVLSSALWILFKFSV